MQRGGGGAVFGEISVDSRRPLIPDVRRLNDAESRSQHFPASIRQRSSPPLRDLRRFTP